MFTLLWKWLVSVFTADKIGILVRKLLLNATKDIAKDVFNIENQKKAYNIVKELHKRGDLTNIQKATLFNEQMGKFLVKSGQVLAESALNCLREMAVVALKTDLQKTLSRKSIYLQTLK